MDPECAAGNNREKNAIFHRNKIQWGKKPNGQSSKSLDNELKICLNFTGVSLGLVGELLRGLSAMVREVWGCLQRNMA